MPDDYLALPDDLSIPQNDGAADHLAGMALPDLTLPSPRGTIDLVEIARGQLVAYVYPRTGVPGQPLPASWDDIPGARGCTPQSCAYRDALAEFERLGVTVVGISAQPSEEQREFAAREHIPFPLLSDPDLKLAGALRLPPSRSRARPSTGVSPWSPRQAASSRSSTPSSHPTATPPRSSPGWSGTMDDLSMEAVGFEPTCVAVARRLLQV